jgi:hypothetical protein
MHPENPQQPLQNAHQDSDDQIRLKTEAQPKQPWNTHSMER